jgi:hypothetical protein
MRRLWHWFYAEMPVKYLVLALTIILILAEIVYWVIL